MLGIQEIFHLNYLRISFLQKRGSSYRIIYLCISESLTLLLCHLRQVNGFLCVQQLYTMQQGFQYFSSVPVLHYLYIRAMMYIQVYIYIRLKIEPNSVRIRFQSGQIFVLPSTGFAPTPLIHCSTIRLALRPAPQTTGPHPLPIYIYKRLKKQPTYEPTGCRIGNKC